MKLNKDLPVCFDKSSSKMSKILAAHMTNLIVWLDDGTFRRHLPWKFKKNFKDCVCIIDFSKIFIERPNYLTLRA